MRMIGMVLVALATAAFAGGCGDGDSGAVKGKYQLAGKAVFEDQDDHSGIKVRIVENGSIVRTGADGSFALPTLADGDWTLKVSRDFYSTRTVFIEVRGGLLVDPIGELVLRRTFFVYLRTDSLRFTHKSDTVGIWLTLVNNDVAQLDLYHPLMPAYDFVVIDPSVSPEEEVWRWSMLHDNPWNQEKHKFEDVVPARDSLIVLPDRGWDKRNMDSSFVPSGRYIIQGELMLTLNKTKVHYFETRRLSIRLVP
jgi:hypothetical protein